MMEPVAELAQLRNGTLASLGAGAMAAGLTLLPNCSGLMLEVDAYFQMPASSAGAQTFGVAVRVSPDASIQTQLLVSYVPPMTTQNNTDRPGDDAYIFNMDPTVPEAINVATCSNACYGNVSCVAWVYVRPGDGPCRCCFKASVPAAVPNTYTLSGVKSASLGVGVDRSLSGSDGTLTPQGGILPPFPSQPSVVRIHAFLDHSIVEVFANEGRARVTSRIYPNATDAVNVGLYSDTGGVSLLNATVWSLNTIWAA